MKVISKLRLAAVTMIPVGVVILIVKAVQYRSGLTEVQKKWGAAYIGNDLVGFIGIALIVVGLVFLIASNVRKDLFEIEDDKPVEDEAEGDTSAYVEDDGSVPKKVREAAAKKANISWMEYFNKTRRN